ncbi:MAG: DUF4493 domain-containing protein [Chloroflexi bacterium]|nr:DUF4493 domain-containing protein [Chloroflexota bacterium]
MKHNFALIVIGSMLLAACAAGAPEGQGIMGLVLLGPHCPVVQEGVPCPDTPYETELVVTSLDGTRIIKEFSSNANGEFEVNLPIGTYAIRSPDPGGLPYCTTNQPVTVEAGAMTEVKVLCDTGIR